MSNLLQKVLRYIGYILFCPIWWLERLIPRSKKIWIFGAWYGEKYSDNSKWLFEYVLEHNPEIKAIWITKSDKIYNKLKSQNLSVYKANTIKSYYFTLRAGFCFLTSGSVDVDAFFLNGCKQVWLWHGMPLKKIGFEDDSYKPLSSFKKTVINLICPYNTLRIDYTISSASFFDKFLSASFKLPDSHILKYGQPRCDVFFTNKRDDYIVKIRNKFTNCKIILYMPTFRMPQLGQGERFNPFSLEFGFDDKLFADILERKNIIFLYKPHFVDADIKISINSNRFMYITDDDYDDLYAVLNSVDALATDYSSVYFDFLCAKKKIFLLPFDYSDYINKSRSHFFNMYEHMNAPYFTNWIDFFEFVNKSKWDNPDGFEKNKFCEYLDGKSCKKITNFFLDVKV